MPKELARSIPDRKIIHAPKPEGPRSVQVTGPDAARSLARSGEAQSLTILKNMPVTAGEVFNPALEMASLKTLEVTMDRASDGICVSEMQNLCPLVVDRDTPTVALFGQLDTSSLQTRIGEQSRSSGMDKICLSLAGDGGTNCPAQGGKGRNPQK